MSIIQLYKNMYQFAKKKKKDLKINLIIIWISFLNLW